MTEEHLTPHAPRHPPRIGLVLSGGGAKGAYQVGVVECIARLGIPVAAVSGCSIGALNGAVIAASPTMAEAADRLAMLWYEVGREAGPALVPAPAAGGRFEEALTVLANLAARTSSPLLRPGFLDDFLRRHLDADAVRNGMPFWVSVFPSQLRDTDAAGWGWFLDAARGRAGVPAQWLHINAMSPEEVHSAVLASAAIPLLLPSRQVGGVHYRDGGLADHTPVGALASQGCFDVLIVVHQRTVPSWDVSKYPGTRVVEVRPQGGLRHPGPAGGFSASLDFSVDRIDALRRQGYAEAEEAFGQAADLLGGPFGDQGIRDLSGLPVLPAEA